MDEEGKRQREECEAAVYLPNKLDRISSIIKERDGENTDAHTHTHTHTQMHKRISHHLTHITHPPSLTHLQINMLTHSSEVSHTYVSACQLSLCQASWWLSYNQPITAQICILLVILLTLFQGRTPPHLTSLASQRFCGVLPSSWADNRHARGSVGATLPLFPLSWPLHLLPHSCSYFSFFPPRFFYSLRKCTSLREEDSLPSKRESVCLQKVCECLYSVIVCARMLLCVCVFVWDRAHTSRDRKGEGERQG